MEQNTKTRIALIYELILVILAFLSVFLIFSENVVVRYLDKIVWALFFADVVIRFILAKNKWTFVKKNPFDIIAAIPLDAIFQTARIARLFRILRLFAISNNYFPKFFKILKTNYLDRVLIVAVLMIVTGGTVVTFTEPNINTFSDGLWWAIVTTTTVGYGDISPDTISGRVVAVILMFIGIGIIGMLTSSITTFFIRDQKKEHPTVEFLHRQLNRIDELSPSELNHIIAILKEYKKEAIHGKEDMERKSSDIRNN
ncbi:potassium channel family protein [Virgibacillus oceani]|uniref:Ion transporter n=1 Tax=Virgibacillus oceani TaxID=1479511 RepID=A0A917H562_9BACI|nr:potassium channel family protein [Virgibacillus oceani]GGG66979.1 ion transporter [Virgibacillus oceani]